MANDTILTDDYVAGLLAKEASDASVRYSSMGLEAFGTAKYVIGTRTPIRAPDCERGSAVQD